MHRCPPWPFALLAIAVFALPPATAEGVPPTDPTLGQPLSATTSALTFLDADGDAQPDSEMPDEPVYLDMDASRDVSFGDVRLTAYGAYPAFTLVDVTNRDTGRRLVVASGWLGVDDGRWSADLDGSRTTSVGDVRLDGDSPGTKLRLGHDGLGHRLESPASAVGITGQLDHVDANRDGRWGVGSALYLDVDGDRIVSAGDLRLTPLGFGLDAEPSPAEVEAALQVLAAAEAARAAAAEEEGGWATWQTATLLAAFAALAIVAIVVVRSRRTAGPRDPFTTAPLAPRRFK